MVLLRRRRRDISMTAAVRAGGKLRSLAQHRRKSEDGIPERAPGGRSPTSSNSNSSSPVAQVQHHHTPGDDTADHDGHGGHAQHSSSSSGPGHSSAIADSDPRLRKYQPGLHEGVGSDSGELQPQPPGSVDAEMQLLRAELSLIREAQEENMKLVLSQVGRLANQVQLLVQQHGAGVSLSA